MVGHSVSTDEIRGSGQFGQLGLGSQNDESVPHLIKELENTKCVFAAAGANSILSSPFFL